MYQMRKFGSITINSRSSAIGSLNKAKFSGLLQVLNLIDNQAYKLELHLNLRFYNIFYISLLKYNNTKK